MKSFVQILTFFVVFFAIFSSSVSIKCLDCYKTPECAMAKGVKVTDCTKTEIPDTVSCVTAMTKEGKFVRGCLEPTNGPAVCQNRTLMYKCKSCSSDKCNNITTF